MSVGAFARAARKILAPEPTDAAVDNGLGREGGLAAALAGPGPWRLPGLLDHPDGYLRHQRLARAIMAEHGGGTVLNVGDPFCQLRRELPGFEVTSTDIVGPLVAVPDGARFVRADFTADQSPFAEGSYDVVCSTDTLEHVPAASRATFIARSAAVARKSSYLAFPAGADARAAENLIRASRSRIAFRDALREHQECGLPDPTEVAATLRELGLRFEIRPLTTIVEWLTSFVLGPLDGEDDQLVHELWKLLNRTAADEPGSGAVYRYLVIVRI